MVSVEKKLHWTVWALVLLIIVAPVASPQEAYAQRYFVWSALVALSLFAIARFPSRQVGSPIAFGMVWMIIAGLVQLIPLNQKWLGLVSGYSAAIYLDTEIVPDPGRISIDSGATFGFVHACAVLLAVCFWRGSGIAGARATRTLEYAVIASASIQAIYGTLSVVTGAELGAFFEPKTAYIGSATGNFVNRSIYGLYLNLGVVACLRVLFFSRTRASYYAMVSVRLAMVILVIGITMSQSRAVGLGFIFVMAIGAVSALVRQRKRSIKTYVRVVLIISSIIIVDVLVVSQWFGLERLTERAVATSADAEHRDDIAKVLLHEHSLVSAPLGFGVGAFESFYPRIETQYIKGRYVRAHADLVEFYVSFGALVVPLLLILVWGIVSGGLVGALLLAALTPHLLLDFAASNWLVWLIIVLLWPRSKYKENSASNEITRKPVMQPD